MLKVNKKINTKTQKIKAELVSKLIAAINKQFDPLNVCFQDKLDVMAEWFSPTKGKLKNSTQHWDESINPQSGLNLIVSTRALTMQNVFVINKYLKKVSQNG